MPPSSQRSASEGTASRSPRSSVNLIAPSKSSERGGGMKRNLPFKDSMITSDASFDIPRPRSGPRASGKRSTTPITRETIRRVQPSWNPEWVPQGPWPQPYDARTYPQYPPGFFGAQGWDPRMQPMFIRSPPEQAAPIHHHSHDNRQVHIDVRQVHINQPTLKPELIHQIQYHRDEDRQFTVEALSAAANEKLQGLETEAQLNINTLTSNMRLAEERANNAFRQHDAAWREEASNTVHMARSEIEASRYKAEIEEKEKHEAAYRLQEAEDEKRNSQHDFTRSSYGQTSAYKKLKTKIEGLLKQQTGLKLRGEQSKSSDRQLKDCAGKPRKLPPLYGRRNLRHRMRACAKRGTPKGSKKRPNCRLISDVQTSTPRLWKSRNWRERLLQPN